MAQRFTVGQLQAADGERSVLALDPAESSTAGTRLLGAELQSLLLQQGGEGSFGQALCGGGGDLFHGIEIDRGARSGFAESVAGNNFAPAGSQVTDFLEVLEGKFALRHGQSCLALTRRGQGAFLFPLYGTVLCLANQVVTSVARVQGNVHRQAVIVAVQLVGKRV
jgi:hypothetical protein